MEDLCINNQHHWAAEGRPLSTLGLPSFSPFHWLGQEATPRGVAKGNTLLQGPETGTGRGV